MPRKLEIDSEQKGWPKRESAAAHDFRSRTEYIFLGEEP